MTRRSPTHIRRLIGRVKDAWRTIDADEPRDRSLPHRTAAELKALYAIPPRKRPPLG